MIDLTGRGNVESRSLRGCPLGYRLNRSTHADGLLANDPRYSPGTTKLYINIPVFTRVEQNTANTLNFDSTYLSTDLHT